MDGCGKAIGPRNTLCPVLRYQPERAAEIDCRDRYLQRDVPAAAYQCDQDETQRPRGHLHHVAQELVRHEIAYRQELVSKHDPYHPVAQQKYHYGEGGCDAHSAPECPDDFPAQGWRAGDLAETGKEVH